MSESDTRRRRGPEWPTLALIAAMWLGFGLITWNHAVLPWWIITPLGACLIALHGSLQHEALHGHPTRSALMNELLLFPPISLWFPYRRYRKLHRIHHRNEFLTDPAEDPESYYFDPQAWAGTPGWLRGIYTLNNTMLGRFIIGPGLVVIRFWYDEARRMRAGDREIIRAWALHALGIALVFAWVSGVCGMNAVAYSALIAYWGNSVSMMRSYAEHRAHEAQGCRTIIVESNPVVSLLFLNNNLHMAHHEVPALAWYRLPAYYRANRERLLKENCGYLMRGYRALARHWLLTPKEPVEHPAMASLPATRNPAARY